MRIRSSAEGVRVLRTAVFGMPQRAFGQRIGRTQSYVSKVESGTVRISERCLRRLEAVAPRSWFLSIQLEVDNERRRAERARANDA